MWLSSNQLKISIFDREKCETGGCCIARKRYTEFARIVGSIFFAREGDKFNY